MPIATLPRRRASSRRKEVEVELILLEGVDDNLEHFREGKADLAFGLQSDAMLLAAQGVPLKIINVTDYSNGGDVIICRLGIKEISSLKGKRVSVDKLNSFNHIFLVELLRLNGMAESDVTVVPLPARDVPDALDNGTIDAGQTWEPYQSQAMAKGHRLLASTRDAPGVVTDVLMVKSDVLEKRTEDIRKILKCLFRALEFRATHETEAYAIMSRAYNVPAGSLKRSVEGNVFPDLDANIQAFENSGALLRAGRLISNFFIRKKIISVHIDPEKIYAPEIVRSLK